MKMYIVIKGKKLSVKKTGNRYFYWGASFRWLPVTKSQVIFE